jgi:hypothetical protein
MRLKLLKTGKMSSIYAVVLDNGTCPAEGFLEQVRRRDLASHKSLINILTRHADHGVLRNKRKSKVIEGRANLLEFKTRQGDRLVYFYLPDRKTVLTHGFRKGASASSEFDKAEAMRDQYRREADNG